MSYVLMKRRKIHLNMIRRFSLSLLIVGMLMLPTLSVLGQQDSPPATIHVVQRGENLFRIAQDYGLTIDDLARINGITDPGSILVGQRLIIPIAELPQVPVDPETHIVQPGETLSSIAAFYETTPQTLASLNNISLGSVIFSGQTLVISDPNAPIIISEMGITITHIVESGETLFGIALQYRTTLGAIQEANEIDDPSQIFAGDTLAIPNAQPPQIALDLPQIITDIDIAPVFFVEGQAGRVRLTTSASASVTGRFLNDDLIVISEVGNTLHTALMPIPIYTEAGIYPMSFSVTDANGQTVNFAINMRILAGGYETQNIELPEDRLDLLNVAIENNEIDILSSLTSRFNPERYFDGSLSLPAAAVMNEPYGVRRSYNGGPVDRYHNGADFAGVPGTPILAAAPGRVVLADTLHIRGISVVIDHGWGLYTNYAHMTERLVELGAYVSTGEQIGTVGNTGRATGAHLHWEVWLNGVAVDPMQWVVQSFP
jgi:murein DD-endopeptidase MepM/ murein hydrolase activator NlpD